MAGSSIALLSPSDDGHHPGKPLGGRYTTDPRARAVALADTSDRAAAAPLCAALQAEIEQAPPGPEVWAVLAILHAARATALGEGGQLREALEHGLQADLLAARSGDPEAQARAMLAIGQTFFRAGHLDEARRRLTQVPEIPGVSVAHAAHARMNVAATLRAEGRLDEAAQAFRAQLALRPGLPPALACSLLINAASCFHQIDHLEEATTALAEARVLLADLDRPDLEAWTRTIGAWVAARSGQPDEALALARPILDPAGRGSGMALRSSAARAMAEAALRHPGPARLAEARAAAGRVLESLHAGGAGREVTELHTALAALHEHEGDLAGAVHHLREARAHEATLAEQGGRLQQEREALRLELLRMQVHAESLRAHQQDLERANHALVVADTARARLLATLAHDLRSPLTAAMAMVELMEPDEPTSVRDGLRSLELALRRMVGILERALAPQGGPDIPPCDLGSIVAAAVGSFGAMATRKAQEIAVDAPPGLGVRADPVTLGRLVDNLLSNALKYSPVAGRIEVRVSRAPHGAVLEVLDRGPGFSGLDPAQGLLYGHQLAARPTGGEASWGLGLHTVYQLLAELGGILALGNREGGGAIVRVTLPLG